ncbi:RHS repeat-associated core domain-containing protein [Pseudomonas alloputida]|uniref:RHS repeat-associated core domain-containing protein n=1 Tax=Pseudomonas TaxID=286 RepID=UPI003EEF60DF
MQQIYTPYGYTRSKQFDHVQLKFNGERLSPVDLYLLGNGYRPYRPTLNRFLSADSFSPFHEQAMNAYAYCLADPINHTDPTGHILKKTFNRLAGKYRTPTLKRKLERMLAAESKPANHSKQNTFSKTEFKKLENHLMDKIVFSKKTRETYQSQQLKSELKQTSPLVRTPQTLNINIHNDKISRLEAMEKSGHTELANLRSLQKVNVDGKERFGVADLNRVIRTD